MKIKNLFLVLAALLLSSVSAWAQNINQGVIGVLVGDDPGLIDDPIDDPSGYLTSEDIEEYGGIAIGGVVYSPYPYEAGSAMVVGYTDGLPANVTVKSKINAYGEEYNVIGIYDRSFASCTSLTSVAIPNSVESIGNVAFYGCENLEIIIPSSVEYIGEYAFAGVKHVINASFCEDEEEEDWGAVKLDWFTNGPEFECELEGGFKCVVWCDYDEEGVDEIGVYITAYTGEGGDITIPYGVTGIDEDAFEHCETITSVKIPETVDYIGDGAFFNCSSLTSVIIPNSVTSIKDAAFYGCSSLTSVTIPNSVEYIGDGTFYGCTSLTSVSIPNSVTTIGNGVFFGCNSLTSVTIPNGVTTIGNDAFMGCENLESLTIPTSVTSIGEDAFFGVKSIINLSLISDEDNWGALADNSIRDGGFIYEANSEKKKLLAYIGDDSEVTIPSDVEIICEYAFLNSNAETVTIPNNAAITNIEDWAFAGVTNVINESSYTEGQPWGAWALNGENGGFSYNNVNGEINLTKYNGEGGDITIPYGVTAIAREAFANCESLTSVKIPETVKTIGSWAFGLCHNLKSATIVEGVESIGGAAFYYCESLTSITIPGSVETIGNYAFEWCENLESATINEGVKTIGEEAFCGCYNLETVTIPSSVTSIGEDAFGGVLIVNNNSSCTDDNNWGAVAVNGIRDGDFIYDAKSEKKKILAYIGNNAIATIPADVEIIGEKAFFYDRAELVSIPENAAITNIEDWAFAGVMYVINESSYTEGQPWGAWELNGDDGGFVYEFDDEFGTILTTYNGEGGDIVIPYGVNIISEGVFAECESLTSVKIPETVKTIGEGAFYGCTSLTSVNIPSGVTVINEDAFYGCTSLTSVNIPNGVTEIGPDAFEDCTSLTSVTIPNSVTEIGPWAFYGCTSLASVNIPSSVEEIGRHAFHGCTSLTSVNIPSSVTEICPWAFHGCTSLTSVTISEGVETIGESAFDGCTSLASVTIPSSVTNIGGGAFAGVKNIINNSSCTDEDNWGALVVNGERDGDFVYEPNTSKSVLLAYIGNGGNVTIPDGVETIGEGAFAYCKSITSVTIPAGVETIGEWAFEEVKNIINNSSCTDEYNWGALTLNGETDGDFVYEPNTGKTVLSAYIGKGGNVTIPDGVVTIDEMAFDGCTSITSVNIPSSVTEIGPWAFYGCTSLTSVNIPSSVTEIYDEAFSGCTSLTSVNIPSSVTEICPWAFHGCTSLVSVNIPSGVTEIGPWAFHGCTSLASVTISEGVETIGGSAFEGCTSLASVTIPESVTSIGRYVFFDCPITEVYCSADPESLSGVEYLPGYDSDQTMTYHVPAEYLELWEGIEEFGNTITFVGDVKSINDEDITIITDITAQTYTGNDLTPAFEVKDGDKTLEEGTDYTITIRNSLAKFEDNCTNVGNYTIAITGRKLYYQTAEKTFTINPASVTVTAEDKTKTFGNAEPEFTATISGLVNNESESLITYTIGRVEGEDVGEYAITPAGAEVQGNYAVSFEAAKLTINVKALTAEEITISEIAAQTYTGEAIEPAFTVKDGDITLEDDKDYTFEYSDNTNVGTAKVTVTCKGNYSGSAEKSFTINPAAVTVTADNKEITFGDSEPTLTATIAGLVNNESESLITYTISRAEGNNAGVYAITPAGDEEQGNYAVSFVEGSLKINKAVPAYTAPTIAEQPCGAKLADIQLGSGFAFAAGSAELASGENKRMVVFTPENTVNYEIVENIELTINVNGHAAGEAVAEKYNAPTCTEAGSVDSVVYCSVCKAELSRKTVEIKIIPHTAGEAVAENYKAPTCTIAGSVDSVVYCTVCKKELSRKTVEIKIIPHTAGEAVAENYKAPTCIEAGSVDSVVYCTVCKEEFSRKTVVIPAAGHKADSVAIENVVAATYTAAGSYDSVVYCSVCKKELSRTKVEVPQLVVPKIDTEVVISQLEYTVGDSLKLDGGKIIIATSDSTTAEVVITPEMVKGFNPDSVGVQTVTVEFTVNDVVYTTTFEVEVKAPEVIEIAAKSVVLTAPAKITYKQGEQLDIAGGKLTVTYSDNSTKDVELKADMISGFDAEKVGTQKLTITLKIDKVVLTATFDVTVEANDNTAISDAEAAAVNIYAYGNTIVVENAENDIYVYDAMGRLIVETPHCDVSTEIRINRAGVYIVKTGTTAKRVMIND